MPGDHTPVNRFGSAPNWLQVWLGFCALWTGFAILGTWMNYEFLFLRGHKVPWSQSIRMNITAYGIWAIILTPIVLYLCAKLPLSRKNLFRLVLTHGLAIPGTVGADIVLKALLHNYVYPDLHLPTFAARLRLYLFSQSEADIQIYILVAVIAYVLAYYAEIRRQENHAAQLENSLIKSELQVLGMQLQPHFLFNTLHSVSALVTTNPRAAQKMICSLGDLLRMSLAGGNAQEVTLRRELEFVQCYFDIQKIRFLNRLTVDTDVPASLLDANVPYLFLQPLVENAIKHGVARCPGSARIEISARVENHHLCVSIVNDGPADHSPHEPAERVGIGLENVRNRLRILYGTDGQLDTSELPAGGFRAEVRIPYNQTEASDEIPMLLFAAAQEEK
ncbi:MAG TPA: histidine kinase [Candidatus Solibacter sp.]|nr:histidine kinase [Candidatus Solibacter sp.]